MALNADWDRSLALLQELFPNLGITREQAVVWEAELGPESRRPNQEIVRAAMRREYAQPADGRSIIVRILKSYDDIKAEQREHAERESRSPEGEDLANAVPVIRNLGRPPLHFCRSAWHSRSPNVRDAVDRLRELDVANPVEMRDAFTDEDEWGWGYAEIPAAAVRAIERRRRPGRP